MFGEGISREGDILDLAAGLDIVMKSGAWYAYDGNKIGQGRENAKQYLKEHAEICEKISQKVRIHYGFEKAAEGSAEQAPQEAAGTEAPLESGKGGRRGAKAKNAQEPNASQD